MRRTPGNPRGVVAGACRPTAVIGRFVDAPSSLSASGADGAAVDRDYDDAEYWLDPRRLRRHARPPRVVSALDRMAGHGVVVAVEGDGFCLARRDLAEVVALLGG